MKKRIHINQHTIKANKRNGTNYPVITVKTYNSNVYYNNLELKDKDGKVVATVVYSPDKPLPCGATVWIETFLDVEEPHVPV